MRGFSRFLGLGVATLLLATAPAYGAIRYASPTGTQSATCPSAAPCDITTAIRGVSPTDVHPGDEVVVAAGAYNLSLPLTGAVPLTIHGPSTGPLPVLTQTSKTGSTLQVARGSRVSRLRLIQARPANLSAALSGSGNDVYDDLVVEPRVTHGVGVLLTTSDILRDSVVSAPSTAAMVTGVRAFAESSGPTVDMRNDTVEIPGNGGIAVSSMGFCIIDPITLRCMPGATSTDLVARNVIARGGTYDLYAFGIDALSEGIIDIDHSNYRAAAVTPPNASGLIRNNGANQTTTNPSLTSDFHELPGSVTVDAGIADPKNGTVDPDGNPRTFGSAPDIGAYELPVTPAVAIGPVSGVAAETVTVNGTVNPRSVPATFQFRYGTTSAYGSSAPAIPGAVAAVNSPTAVSAHLTGLHPSTTYHYQLTATNAAGSQSTTDATFTTPAQPKPPAAKAKLSAVRETNATFVVGRSSTPLTGRTAATRHKVGTIFLFRIDQPATVKIAIQTKARGRRVGRRCKADSRRLRRKPRCIRTVTIVTLTRIAHVGLNKVAFSGRIHGKALTPGRYQAVFTAYNRAGASKPQTLSFTIVSD